MIRYNLFMNATLANLITNANGLRLFCDGCDRCVVLDVDELVSRYGGDMELPETAGDMAP